MLQKYSVMEEKVPEWKRGLTEEKEIKRKGMKEERKEGQRRVGP